MGKKLKIAKAKCENLERVKLGILTNQKQFKTMDFSKISKLSQKDQGNSGRSSQDKTDWFLKFMEERQKNEKLLKKLEEAIGIKHTTEGGDDNQPYVVSQADSINIVFKLKGHDLPKKNLSIHVGSTVENLKEMLKKEFAIE